MSAINSIHDLEDFYGPNAGYVLDLYERYKQDPESVDPETRAIFEKWSPPEVAAKAAGPAPAAAGFGPSAGCSEEDLAKIVAAARISRLIREHGHLAAHIDPLGAPPPGDPDLELSAHGLETRDLASMPASVVGGPLADGAPNALEAVGRLRRAYSGSVGYEDDHIQIHEERQWMRTAVESGRYFSPMSADQKRELLERLSEVETFERFLHQNFPTSKWFSLEGNDMLVPMLDLIVREAAATGTREVVMGMAHRGRLNVLAHVLGKPYESILEEFQHGHEEVDTNVSESDSTGYAGDVKYHLGYRREYREKGIEQMPLTLAPNPSHLEFVDPVVVGRARAAQEDRANRGAPRHDPKASLAILIHGDAAFPGEGIVAETLNLSRLNGYAVGGTIHIIVNNQIGFTTGPGEARSTLYASDLAKGFEIPIVHVNADDPEACLAVACMAFDYRERYGKDFLIDLVGYRRYGHNEIDVPEFTQPRMYEAIRAHPTVRELWARELERQHVVTRDEADAMVKEVQQRLQAAKTVPPALDPLRERSGLHAETGHAPPVKTAVSADRLTTLNEMLLARPEGFTVDAKLERTVLDRRRTGLEQKGGINWAHAEALAFAAILAEGTPIRFTGQDTERGTFGHRHLVLHDPTTGERYCPMQALPAARASFAVYNSPLSENGPLGFEYGYSIHATEALVLWEAQFGDFANSAQVYIDQFLVSGNAKWLQTPSLVLLLPHGYEGQGPEHSSARLERYLQLCADDNIRVVNCTTPAQYFHVLRRQAALLKVSPRPLVIMTPKALLREPLVGSSLEDLAEGSFQPVIDDEAALARAEQVTRLVLCSGKVYVDLIKQRDRQPEANRVAIARLEEFYPFPADEIRELIGGYPRLTEVVWLQEEPKNMGAWGFVGPRLYNMLDGMLELRYVGRPDSASPAEGSSDRHDATQARIIMAAFGDAPEPMLERSAVGYGG